MNLAPIFLLSRFISDERLCENIKKRVNLLLAECFLIYITVTALILLPFLYFLYEQNVLERFYCKKIPVLYVRFVEQDIGRCNYTGQWAGHLRTLYLSTSTVIRPD
eukprot:sb/3477773/